MGNLAQIARYCDCLETPWEQYQSQPSQPSSSSHRPKKVLKHSVENPIHQQHHNKLDPSIKKQDDTGFHFPTFEQLNDKKLQNHKANLIVKELDDHEVNTQGDYQDDFLKARDEMQVIDLEKIQPALRAEAKKKQSKTKHKGNPPLKVQQKLPLSEQKRTNSKSEDSLSNMFEEKGKYFIDENEAQIYNLDQNKYQKY